jgi:DNA-binding SARP family transcriptional activator/TolB-like protein
LHVSRMKAGHSGTEPAATQALLRIRLFSTMEVLDASGFSLLPKSRKARGVLAVLAMSAGHPVTRDEVAALLWSRREREQARSSLRQVVHELNELLGEINPALFLVDRTHLALGSLRSDQDLADLVWVDAKALSPDDAAKPVMPELFQHGLVEDLLGLDPAFDRWRKAHAERLFVVARGHAENWLTRCERDGGKVAVQAAQQLLRIDPAHERAWRVVIRGYLTEGDSAAAMYAYERCADALAAAGLGAPSDETSALLSGFGTNLPVPNDITLLVLPRTHPVRIGVMPLRNLDGSSADEFSLGLTAEITHALSGVNWLSCIGPSSMGATASQDTTELWKSLALDFLMEGTVQRAAGKVRVMIQLLDLHAGNQLSSPNVLIAAKRKSSVFRKPSPPRPSRPCMRCWRRAAGGRRPDGSTESGAEPHRHPS